MRRLVLLYSQPGDEILDPFLGSGTTAIVAKRCGRKCVGYDVEEEYLKLAENRLKMTSTSRRKYHLLPSWDKVEVTLN